VWWKDLCIMGDEEKNGEASWFKEKVGRVVGDVDITSFRCDAGWIGIVCGLDLDFILWATFTHKKWKDDNFYGKKFRH